MRVEGKTERLSTIVSLKYGLKLSVIGSKASPLNVLLLILLLAILPVSNF